MREMITSSFRGVVLVWSRLLFHTAVSFLILRYRHDAASKSRGNSGSKGSFGLPSASALMVQIPAEATFGEQVSEGNEVPSMEELPRLRGTGSLGNGNRQSLFVGPYPDAGEGAGPVTIVATKGSRFIRDGTASADYIANAAAAFEVSSSPGGILNEGNEMQQQRWQQQPYLKSMRRAVLLEESPKEKQRSKPSSTKAQLFIPVGEQQENRHQKSMDNTFGVESLPGELRASDRGLQEHGNAEENHDKSIVQVDHQADVPGMVKFQMDGDVSVYMTDGALRQYLNRLVEESVVASDSQTSNIAFVKTHKTASTTAATILYRYGRRHGIKVANFEEFQSYIELSEAAQLVEESGEPLDLMHYHYAWDGFYGDSWANAKAAYKRIMRDPSDIKFVTVLREPVSHYLSYFYYFMQPYRQVSIVEYLSAEPDNGQPMPKPWHGYKFLYNPLCAEFGIHSPEDVEAFIRNDLPEFAMILITEFFQESLALFMRMFGWHPIDMTFCRVFETKEGDTRYDGKTLQAIPKVADLPPEVVAKIKRQTQLDQALYNAAIDVFKDRRSQYAPFLESDLRNIQTVQSAVQGYLDFDPMTPAHKWYQGDVHCFEDQSPVQPF